MGPIAYSLCHKPAIGIAMLISTLCAFPPLLQDAPIALDSAGSVAGGAFTVPVDKSYLFILKFQFPSGKAYSDDRVGGTSYNQYCHGPIDYQEIPLQQRKDLGNPIPIQVIVRSKTDGAVVVDHTFTSLCITGHSAPFIKWRDIGRVRLVRGDYIAEVKNLDAQPGLDGVLVSVSLVAGDAK